MAKYDYEKDGEVKEFEFPIGKAPQEFEGWKKVVSMPYATFVGEGWARDLYREW